MAATGALAAFSGCGQTGSSPTTPASTPTSPTGPTGIAGVGLRSGQSDGVGAVRVPGLGAVSYRCDRSSQRVSATLGGPFSATETVTVEAEHHRHLRAGTMNPSAQLTVPAAAYRSLTWRLIQSTEPKTIEATITLNFQGASPGATAPIGCSPTRWNSIVNIIRHDKQWSPPPAWP
jgi:hypothetical protein